MKSLMAIFTVSLLIAACGKNETGGKKKSGSTISGLSHYGIEITPAQQNNSFSGSNSTFEYMTISCVPRDVNGLTNAKRLQRLKDYRAVVSRSHKVTIKGKNYDAQSLGYLLDEAIQNMEMVANNNINNNNGSFGNNNGNYGNYGSGGSIYGSIGYGYGYGNNYGNYGNYGSNNGNYGNYGNNNGNFNNNSSNYCNYQLATNGVYTAR